MPKQFMPRLLTVSLVTLLLAGCSSYQPPLADGSQLHRDSVSVTGTGKVQAVPDRFRVRAVASREGNDINAMKQAVDQEIAAVLTQAKQLGIEEKQLRASTLTVQPQWQWEPERKLVGYRVARDIEAVVDGLDAYAKLLEAMTELSLSEVWPVGSEIRNQEAVEQQALTAAVANARARATALAAAAGRKLGAVVSIQELGGQPPVPMAAMEMRAAKDASNNWTPGETEVHQQVQVQFLLE